jgi:hypothetical protein
MTSRSKNPLVAGKVDLRIHSTKFRELKASAFSLLCCLSQKSIPHLALKSNYLSADVNLRFYQITILQ